MKNLKKNKIEILELKNALTESRNVIESFSCKFDHAEERICELEDNVKLTTHRSKKKKK